MLNAAYWIEKLNLLPHPEGGYFKETYRSNDTSTFQLGGLQKTRAHSTSIYFLMEKGNFSAFHRILSDEVWHFYAGESLEVFYIDHNGLLQRIFLGSNPENGEQLQGVVPANCWFASRPFLKSHYSLVGCTVAPGFDFEDFEMAKRASLIQEFPEHQKIIEELTRD
jgi:uncharacterized protein